MREDGVLQIKQHKVESSRLRDQQDVKYTPYFSAVFKLREGVTSNSISELKLSGAEPPHFFIHSKKHAFSRHQLLRMGSSNLSDHLFKFMNHNIVEIQDNMDIRIYAVLSA